MRVKTLAVLIGLTAAAAVAQRVAPAVPPTNPPSVFLFPLIQERYAPLAYRIDALFKQREYAAAATVCTQAVAMVPWDGGAYYNLACAEARLGQTEAAFTHLTQAVAFGFRDPDHIRADADLASLRTDKRFARILVLARDQTPPAFLKREVKPLPVQDGVAWVTESNTAWDARNGVFASLFVPDTNRSAAVIVGHGAAGELLRAWFKEGTAAGNRGDLYDNRDAGHSRLPCEQFPQLTPIRYCPQVVSNGLHWGLQALFFFNGVTFGNSSTAQTGGPYWRGQARFAYADARKAGLLYLQYVGNHLYFYPEHKDHDPGVDGKGDGYGDVSPANTPYLIISQGSSGSDQPFMDAVACTLAAFRPEVKGLLARTGALMPTVQMIFRMSNRTVLSPEDYLTGKAHPTVFEGGNVDLAKMIRMAHDMPSNAVPPVIQLKADDEDQAVVGRDYFDAADRERLFDTPCAIARVARSLRYTHRMVVSAKASKDLNDRPLTFTWRVLRGDADRITIRPLNKAGSVAELVVPYHERGPIATNAPLVSSRVDIGVFAHNGVCYSAPGFVTFYYLANEKRVYDDHQRIRVCDYADPEYKGRYVDPMLDLPKDWRDEYQYDDQGRLTGWTRSRGEQKEEFTADGAIVMATDSLNRPLKARTVVYRVAPHGRDVPPTLAQVLGNEILLYKYTGTQDRIGTITSRETVAAAGKPSAAESPTPVE